MAVDTPARIAILGGGPIGLEAALYARYLGYQVDLYERGRIGENLLCWGHVRLFSPFRLNRSPLALGALRAQDADYQSPDDDALLTGREHLERYLKPLAQTDLLVDSIQEQVEVLAVGRDENFKGDLFGDPERGDDEFLLLLRDQDGTQRHARADVVIDCTGTYGNPNWLGQGGLPAVGEASARASVEYGLPDVLGQNRSDYAGKKVLVVGSGYSAATSVVALAELAQAEPQTHITWLTRHSRQPPIARFEKDRLPERDRLAVQANAIAQSEGSPVTHWPATMIAAVAPTAGGFRVQTVGAHAGEFEFDRIVANVGYRPDTDVFRELQVHLCYATEGPMKLAAALMGSPAGDCLDQTSHGPQTLMNPEPHFYILGAKSYGRNSQFLMTVGLDQIRELFTIIGDREDLDLYAPSERPT